MAAPYFPQCGAEPSYYQYIGNNKVEAIDHMSWENCQADAVRSSAAESAQQYAQTHTYAPYTYNPADYPPPPVADQANVWITTHSALLGGVAGAVLITVVVTALVIWARRDAAKARARSRELNDSEILSG